MYWVNKKCFSQLQHIIVNMLVYSSSRCCSTGFKLTFTKNFGDRNFYRGPDSLNSQSLWNKNTKYNLSNCEIRETRNT